MEVLTQALINSRVNNDSVQWQLRVQTSLEIRIPILKKKNLNLQCIEYNTGLVFMSTSTLLWRSQLNRLFPSV